MDVSRQPPPDVLRRRVRVHSLAAPYAGSVPPSADGTNQVVLEPSAQTVDALKTINRINAMDDNIAKVADPADVLVRELVFEDLQNRINEVASHSGTAERLDTADAVVRLERLSGVGGLPDMVYQGGLASEIARRRARAPRESAAEPIAETTIVPPARRRVRRGGSAPTGLAPGAAGQRDPPIGEIVKQTPTTLGLSARIARAAMDNLVNREPNAGPGALRARTLDTAMRPKNDDEGDCEFVCTLEAYGSTAHMPAMEDAAAWKTCAYDVTLRWTGLKAPYTVTLEVTHPAERPVRWAVQGLAWMPAVALIENGSAVLNRVLQAFDVQSSGDTALRDALAAELSVPNGTDASGGVTIGAVGVGTSNELNNTDALNERLRAIEHWSPQRYDQCTTHFATFRLHTCPLLAATSWPLTYTGDVATVDLQLARAIEDYGDPTIVHSRTASDASELRDDASFDRTGEQRVAPVSIESLRLMTLTQSPARWYVEHDPLAFDCVDYVNALHKAVRSTLSAVKDAIVYLRKPTRREARVGASRAYHPAAWGLIAPLSSMESVLARMRRLIEEEQDDALRAHEFKALVMQAGNDAARYNTLLMGVPLWTPVRDELSDLYEAAINGRPELVKNQGSAIEAFEGRGSGAGDDEYDLDVHACMEARRQTGGFARRAAQQLEDRNALMVRAYTQDAAQELVGMTTGLGAGAMRTPEKVAACVIKAIAAMTKALRDAARESPHGEQWERVLGGCKDDLEVACDAVCTTWRQANKDTMLHLVRSHVEGRRPDHVLEGIETAYAVVQSARRDLRTAEQQLGARLRTAPRDDAARRCHARFLERLLRVARAKLAVAATRIDPAGGTVVGTADIRSLLCDVEGDPTREGARQILEAFKQNAFGVSVGVRPGVFEAAFARPNPSRKIDVVLDAAYIVLGAIHESGGCTFDLQEAEQRLNAEELRLMLRKSPEGVAMPSCVLMVLRAISDLPGFDLSTLRPRTVVNILCVVCRVSHRLCDQWLAGEDTDAALDAPAERPGYDEEPGSPRPAAPTTDVERESDVLEDTDAALDELRAFLASPDLETIEAGAGTPEPQPNRLIEQVGRLAARALEAMARRRKMPMLSARTMSNAALVAGALLASNLGRRSMPTILEEEMALNITEGAQPAEPAHAEAWLSAPLGEPLYTTDPVFDPDVPTERTFYEFVAADGLCLAPGFIADLGTPDVGTGPALTNDTLGHVQALARLNPDCVADVIANASVDYRHTGGVRLADAVTSGLHAMSALAVSDGERYPLSQWVTDAQTEDRCELVELGGWNTTLGKGGERIVTDTVAGDTRGACEFVIARARCSAHEHMASDGESLRLGISSAMLRLNMKAGFAMPGWMDDTYARRCADYGIVPVGRGTPEQLNGMADLVCFEAGPRARFARAFGAVSRGSGSWYLKSNARTLVRHMLTQEELDDARPVNANGDSRDTSTFLESPSAETAGPARPLPPAPPVWFSERGGPRGGTLLTTRLGNMDLNVLSRSSVSFVAPVAEAGGDAVGGRSAAYYVASDELKPHAASKDVGAPIVAPEGRTCHALAAAALRAAVQRSVGESPYAKKALIERIGNRSSAAFTADLVPGVSALEHGAQHYLFCQHACVETLRGVPIAEGTAWDAAAALLALPQLGDDDTMTLRRVLTTAEKFERGQLEGLDAPGEAALDADVEGSAITESFEDLGDETGVAFATDGALDTTPDSVGVHIRNILLFQAGASFVGAMGIVVLSQLSEQSLHLNGPLAMALFADQVRRVAVAGLAASGVWVRATNVDELNRDANVAWQRYDNRENALPAALEGADLIIENVTRDYLRQVSMDVASLFFMGLGGANLAQGLGAHRTASAAINGTVVGALAFGSMMDLWQGLDALFDRQGTAGPQEAPHATRLSGRFVIGSFFTLVLQQLALGSSISFTWINMSQLNWGSVKDFLVPFVVRGHLMLTASTILSVGVAVTRWSPRLGSWIQRLFRGERNADPASLTWTDFHFGKSASYLYMLVEGMMLFTGTPTMFNHLIGADRAARIVETALLGHDNRFGAKLMQGFAVQAVGNVLASAMIKIRARPGNEAGVATIDIATVSTIAFSMSGLAYLSGAASLFEVGTGYRGTATVLCNTVTMAQGTGWNQGAAHWMVEESASGDPIQLLTPYQLVGKTLLWTGTSAAAYLTTVGLANQLLRQTSGKRLYRLALAAGVVMPAYAFGQLSATGKQVETEAHSEINAIWNQRVLEGQVQSQLLVGAFVAYELGEGAIEYVRQRVVNVPVDDLHFQRQHERPERIELFFATTAGKVVLSASLLYMVVHAYWVLTSDDTIEEPEMRESLMKTFELFESEVPAYNAREHWLFGAFVRWLPSLMHSGSGTTTSIGAKSKWNETVDRLSDALVFTEPKGLEKAREPADVVAMETYLSGLGSSASGIATLLRRVAEERLKRRDAHAILDALPEMDVAAHGLLAEAAARMHAADSPSPLSALVDVPGVGVAALRACEGLLSALEPPERLANRTTSTEVCTAPVAAAPPSDWFGAWLGEEPEKERSKRSIEPSKEAAYIRVGSENVDVGSNTGLDGLRALRANPRHLGDLLAATQPLQEVGDELKWTSLGIISDATELEELHLARFGFALVPRASSVGERHIVNMLARNLALSKAHPWQGGNQLLPVYRYGKQSAAPLDSPKATTQLCRAFVAECTQRLALSVALRRDGGVEWDEQEAACQAFEGVTRRNRRLRVVGHEDLLSLVVSSTYEAVKEYVAGPYNEAIAAFEADLPQSTRPGPLLGMLHKRIAREAFDAEHEQRYKLTLPRQVARLDAKTLLESGDESRPQLPLSQTIEYAAVAAIREAEALEMGTDVSAEWVRFSAMCDAVSPRNGGPGMGVVVAREANQRVTTTTLVRGARVALNGGGDVSNRFRDLQPWALLSRRVSAHTFVLCEHDGADLVASRGPPSRATMVYMACRLIALASRTAPAASASVVRAVTVQRRALKQDDSDLTKYEDIVADRGSAVQYPYTAATRKPVDIAKVALRIVDEMRTHATSVERLAIVVALGPMQLEPYTDPKTLYEPSFPTQFPRSDTTSVVTSLQSTRASLSESGPDTAEHSHVELAQRTPVAVAQAAADVMRAGSAGGLISRDAMRVAEWGLINKISGPSIARQTNTHREVPPLAIGYIDSVDDLDEQRVGMSASTPFLHEAWGTMGLYSPDSAHRAAEALQVAAIVSALQRQQLTDIKVSDMSRAAINDLADKTDKLLRAALQHGEAESDEVGLTMLRAGLAIAGGAHMLNPVNRRDGGWFVHLLDVFGRALAFTELANMPAGRSYVAGVAAMVFAIGASPLGETKAGVDMVSQMLVMYFSVTIAHVLMEKAGIGVGQVVRSQLWVQKVLKRSRGGSYAIVAGAGAGVTSLLAMTGFAALQLLMSTSRLALALHDHDSTWMEFLAQLSPHVLMHNFSMQTFDAFHQKLQLDFANAQGSASGTAKQAAMWLKSVAYSVLGQALVTCLSHGVARVLQVDELFALTPRFELRPAQNVPDQIREEYLSPAGGPSEAEAKPIIQKAARGGFSRAGQIPPGHDNEQSSQSSPPPSPPDPAPVFQRRAPNTRAPKLFIPKFDTENVKHLAQVARKFALDEAGFDLNGDTLNGIAIPSPSNAITVHEGIATLIRDLQVLYVTDFALPSINPTIDAKKGVEQANHTAAYIANRLAAARPSVMPGKTDYAALVEGTVRLLWLCAAKMRASDDAAKLERLRSAVAEWMPPGQAVDEFLQGDDPIADGGLKFDAQRMRAEWSAGTLSEGWIMTETGVRVATMGTLGKTFQDILYSAIVGDDVTNNGKAGVLHAELNKAALYYTQDSTALGIAANYDAVQYYFLKGNEQAAALPQLRERMRTWLRGGGYFNPGARSWLMTALGAALVAWRFALEARMAVAMRSSRWFDGNVAVPHIFKRAAQLNPAWGAVAGIGLAMQVLIVRVGDQVAPAWMEYGIALWSGYSKEEAEKRFNDVMQNGWIVSPAHTATVLLWITLFSNTALTGFYRQTIAPMMQWYGSEDVRRLIRKSPSGRGMLPAPVDRAKVGWLTRSTVPKSTNAERGDDEQSLSRRSGNAILLTEYAVEVAALVAVGELRDCSDPLDMGAIEDGLWARMKADGALFDGLGPDLTKELKARATTAYATMRSKGVMSRRVVEAKDSRRFAPIDKTQPRARAAYAALFGGVPSRGGPARPAVLLGHASVGEESVRMTDALRGAVAGGYDYDMLSNVNTWDHHALLTPQRWRAEYTHDDALCAMLVQHLASAWTTASHAEFALLVRAVLKTRHNDAHWAGWDDDEDVKWAVDEVLAPLKRAVATFRVRADSTGDALASVPLCGLGVRRRGLTEQGRLAVLWSWDAPPLPVDEDKIAFGAQHGMTDRYLREGLEAKRLGRPANSKDVARLLYELWSETRTLETRQLVCVPFGDYDCLSFDDVVLDIGDTKLEELSAQLMAATKHTIAVRRALEILRTPTYFDTLQQAVGIVHADRYAPAVRTPRNALLPRSVLGLSDVIDDAQRARYLGRVNNE